MREVAVLVLPGVLDAALAVLLDILDAANRVQVARRRAPAFSTSLWGVDGRVVTSGLGQPIHTHGTLVGWRRRPAIVIVPGENQIDGGKLVALVQSPARRAFHRALTRAYGHGALLAANCTGSFHLAEAGLLAGRCATTAWFLAPSFRRHYPGVELCEHNTLVRDGRLWTAGAALSITDLALALVREFAGASTEREVARYLVLENHPSQARYMMATHYAAQDPTVARAESWVRARLDRSFTIADLARALGTSPRTLTRRLAAAIALSPIRFVQRIRVEHAAHLLETSNHGVDEIARMVGYENPSTLRRVLRREMAQSASEIRQRGAGARGRSPRPTPRASVQ